MPRPALFVVKATIAPELETAFNQWYDTVRSKETAQVPGCLAMLVPHHSIYSWGRMQEVWRDK